jgi:hypothetical protein
MAVLPRNRWKTDFQWEEEKPIMISLELQIKAVEREIAMRRGVYPRWVTNKKMSQEKADFEIEAMEAVLATLKNLQGNGNQSPDH